MGDVRFPWYARKYCRPRRDMVDTSAWKMISMEDEEESVRKKKSFKQVASTIKTRYPMRLLMYCWCN